MDFQKEYTSGNNGNNGKLSYCGHAANFFSSGIKQYITRELRVAIFDYIP
jgi:hypothetical protein